tara:strand:+ start:2692 stop:3657 length:966 start_codon:yes stop_codon:yes gene_type:complete
MSKSINRRRAIQLIAVGAGLPPAISLWDYFSNSKPAQFDWQGRALGIRASMHIRHSDQNKAAKIVALSLQELDRLERIFSLYRPDSELVALNRDGTLPHPSPELRQVLEESMRISELSNGAFDVTVQPLWDCHQNYHADGVAADKAAIENALRLVDYRKLEISASQIRLPVKGMAITLNGIAQGYITDRIADLMQNSGLDQVLVQLGEIHGRAPEHRPWRIGLEGLDDQFNLTTGAVATSSGSGTMFSGTANHLLNPINGTSPGHYKSVSIIAARAMTADAVSTAIYTAPKSLSPRISTASGILGYVLEHADGHIERRSFG